MKNIGIPIKLSETPGQFQRPAPALGQHTNEVLTDLGCSPDDIDRLRGDGVVA